MKRSHLFGRGCTCVVAGLAIVPFGYFGGDGLSNVLALILAAGLLYPGFTMIGMALWPEQ